MTRNRKRLERLEMISSDKPLGYLSFVYARDTADYERRKAAHLAAGEAEAGDWWLRDAMPEPAPERLFERCPVTVSHDERVRRWAEESQP